MLWIWHQFRGFLSCMVTVLMSMHTLKHSSVQNESLLVEYLNRTNLPCMGKTSFFINALLQENSVTLTREYAVDGEFCGCGSRALKSCDTYLW